MMEAQSHTPPPKTILVVEDEVVVRMDMAEFLRQSGYRVQEATNAAEAVKILDSKLTIDLVVSDIRMPGEMDGRGLAKWVQNSRPDLHVILTSAYSQSREDEAMQNVSYLGKPYTGRALLQRVQKTLNQNRSRPS